LVDLKAAVAEHVLSGRGNPDGIHWNFEAHQAVADLTLKALAEAGVTAADARSKTASADARSKTASADARSKTASADARSKAVSEARSD
jgi:hypothetical protein